MVKLHLLPQTEKLAPGDPFGMSYPLLYHQLRTFEALADYDLVVNAYNTGTGKTVASLLQLFRLNGQGRNVLFIAPTNALLHQHVESVERFVQAHGLDFRVLEVNAARLRQFAEGQRPGETLQRLIQNPLEFAEALGIPLDDHCKRPIILVVNPDIFYYALYFRYGSHDQRNIFQKFLTAFDYIVIDEFHYYDSKQLANFLFFFVISQEFDYFACGRRLCLLSATPNQDVLLYLNRVFGARWTLLTPENEPQESESYATTPVLTALDLEIMEAEIQDWAAGHRRELALWLDARQEGALISSALWRVNACYTALRGAVGEARLGRITGPEPEAKRTQFTGFPLILATPTVDIGYNFEKGGRARQNIDFIVCDARYGDELLQRLGRAGRVLGKVQQDTPSNAIALLGDEALRALAAHDGMTLSRAEFAAVVNGCAALPPKQTLYAYIRTHAITECFYPIYQVERMMPDDLQDRVEALYMRVCEVFAPNSQRSAKFLRGFFHRYWKRRQWLRDSKTRISFGHETAIQLADWFKWLGDAEYSPADLVPHLPHFLAQEEQRQGLKDFVAGQVQLAEALFSFRDSFQGPMAVVYDRQHLLSSEMINDYGLMHLVSNYRMRWLDGRAEFTRTFGAPEQKGDLYGVIEGWREPRLTLELSLESPWTRDKFDERVCRRPVALRGLRLAAREQGGDPYPLDARIAQVLGDQYVTVLGITPQDGGVVYGKFKGTSLYARRLTVLFPDGQSDEAYRIFLGTQAFQAHAELLGYFYMQDRLKSEAIII